MADPDIVIVRSLGAGGAEAVAIDSSDGLVELFPDRSLTRRLL